MNKLVTLGAVLAVLGASSFAANLLISAREEPKQKARVQRGVSVETLTVHEREHRLDVRASGVVVPARDLEVFTQVSGRVEWLYENLMPGTFVEKGQPLFRIDTRNYSLRVEQESAELKRAESALELELGQQKIAKSELELLQRTAQRREPAEPDLEEHALALRKPQLEAAKGDVAAAEARLEGAQLDLARTSFAPRFDAVVIESNAEIGQLATPQTRLARLVGTEEFWVRVALPKDQLTHIAIAGIGEDQGSPATVRQEVGERVVERPGHVIRLLSNLEPGSRMARVLVSVADPYGLEQAEKSGQRPYPILLDAYVNVVIEGKQKRRLIEVPRKALREGNVVFVYEPKSQELSIRSVEIAWRLPDSVLVERGLEDGARVVTSPIAGAVDGMKLREVKASERPAP